MTDEDDLKREYDAGWQAGYDAARTFPEPCAHRFQRVHRWLPKSPWVCVRCGFSTRHYDSIDARAGRPIHPHMSVAFKGVNTQQKPRSLDGDPS